MSRLLNQNRFIKEADEFSLRISLEMHNILILI